MGAIEDELQAEKRIAELERTAVRLQRQLAESKAKTAKLIEAVKEAAHDAQVIVGRPKPVRHKRLAAGKGDPEVAVAVFSDWQLGKQTRTYDSDVCVDRVRYVVERVRRITQIQRKDHPVNQAVVVFQGDHVEGGGGIFPGQAYEVDSSGYAQLMTASNLMTEIVLTLLQDFDAVRVHAVHGNHGRIGRKGDLPREDNLDLIAYAIARNQLQDQDRVTWHENLQWYDHVEIGNWSAMLVHGDQIKGYTAGIPAAAIARRATAWSSSMPFKWNDLLIGHYHQNIVVTLPDGGQVRMTPSTESGSLYAAEFMAAAGRPGQRLMYVHPEKGAVTSEYMIWLD